jgi:hypothetical protein
MSPLQVIPKEITPKVMRRDGTLTNLTVTIKKKNENKEKKKTRKNSPSPFFFSSKRPRPYGPRDKRHRISLKARPFFDVFERELKNKKKTRAKTKRPLTHPARKKTGNAPLIKRIGLFDSHLGYSRMKYTVNPTFKTPITRKMTP